MEASSLRRRSASKILPQVTDFFLDGSVSKLKIVQHTEGNLTLSGTGFALHLRMLNAPIHSEHYGNYGTEPRKKIPVQRVKG